MAIGNSKKQLLMVEKEDGLFVGVPMTNVVDIELSTNGDDISIVSPSMGTKRNYMDEYHSTATFNIETFLTGTIINDGANEVSNLNTLFKLCGLKSTIDTGSVVYSPDSNASSNLRLNFYKEDVKRTLTGSKGSLTISGTVGQPLKIVFNMSAYSTLVPTIESAPTSIDASKMDNIAVLKKVSGVTVSGTTLNITSFTLNQNAEIQDTYATALSEFNITDFDYKIELIAYKIKNNDTAIWQAYRNEDLQEIIITAEASNGKEIEIKVPAAKILNLTDGDDNGRQIITRSYRCQNIIGDDNISLTIRD